MVEGAGADVADAGMVVLYTLDVDERPKGDVWMKRWAFLALQTLLNHSI